MDNKKKEYYVVVDFVEEIISGRTVLSVVSSTWLYQNMGVDFCYWPKYIKNFNQTKLNKLVIDHTKIDTAKSEVYKVVIKYKSSNYTRACEKIKILEDQSNVEQTDTDGENLSQTLRQSRPKKKNSLFNDFDMSDSCSNDSEYMGPVAPNLITSLKKFQKPKENNQSTFQQLSQLYPEPTENESTYTLLKQLPQPHLEPDRNQSTYASFHQLPQAHLEPASNQSTYDSLHQLPQSHLEPASNQSTYDSLHKLPRSRPEPSSSHLPVVLPCTGCQKNEGLLISLLSKVEELRQDMKFLMLSQNAMTNSEALVEIPSPCSTKVELEELNDSLADKEKFLSMCNALCTVGGKDSVDTIRRVIGRLLSNDLAVLYNWTGRNQKENFSKLENIVKLILVAVRKNPLSKNTTRQQVEDITKLYLRNVSDKDGGRDRRKKRIQD